MNLQSNLQPAKWRYKENVGCKQVVKMNIDFEFGDYRIIYELNQNELIILVTKADNRGQAYK